MLRRNSRRRRSRTRPRATEMTVENVIEVWKSEAFQKEHGDSKEKIEKIISKWKMIEKGETSKQRSKDNEQEHLNILPSKASMNQNSAKEKYESQPVESDDIDCINYKCDHCEYAKKSKNSVEKHMLEKH